MNSIQIVWHTKKYEQQICALYITKKQYFNKFLYNDFGSKQRVFNQEYFNKLLKLSYKYLNQIN